MAYLSPHGRAGATLPPLPTTRFWKCVALAAVYAVAARLGLLLAFQHPSATPVWSPTGIALAAALLWGYGVWPGVLLGAFLGNIATTGPLTSTGIAIGNTLEAMVGYYLVTRFAGGRGAFDHPQDVLKFAGLAGLASTAVSASFGVTALALGGYAEWGHFGPIWLVWWLGDMGGALVVTPLLLLWSANPRISWTWSLGRDLIVTLGLIVVVSEGVFGGRLFPEAAHYPVGFVAIPILVWVAYRLGRRAAATAVVLLSAVTIWKTLNGSGPFAGEPPSVSFLLLDAYLCVLAVTTLVLAAAIVDRARAEQDRQEQIAERRRVEAALRAESRFRELMESAPDAMVIAGENGRIVLVNSQAETLFGYTRRELIGQALETLVPERSRQRHAGHRAAYAAGPRLRPMGSGLDLHGRRRDGSEFPVEISLGPIHSEEGTLIVSSIRDVSERRRTEEALTHLAAIVKSSSDAIISKRLDGTIVSWNPGAERLYGYSAEEVKGKSVSLLSPSGRDDEVRELLNRLTRGEMVESYETAGKTKDGRLIQVSLSISPIRDAEGRVTGGSVVARDITAKKRAEEALQRANHQLEAFADSVAHDLRAPLRRLRSLAEALIEEHGDALDDTGREYARRLSTVAARTDALTLSLLEYSRVSRADLPLDPVALDRVVSEALALLEAEIESRSARIQVADWLPSVLAHEATLTQIVANLVSNAIKFVGPGVTPEVRLWAEDREDRARLWVEDNGIGIEPRYHQRIFHVFERLHDADAYPGSGLGLAIVRKGVERMGGRIGVESLLQHGSRFWIELRKENA